MFMQNVIKAVVKMAKGRTPGIMAILMRVIGSMGIGLAKGNQPGLMAILKKVTILMGY